jgi:hypothetical protein
LAYNALSRIFEEVKLPTKAAWRVSRVLSRIRPIVVSFETTQRKLFLDAGGRIEGQSVLIDNVERMNDESDFTFATRREEHRQQMSKLQDEVMELDQEVVALDCDPIPLSLFPEAVEIRPTDLMSAGSFLIETS